jgi:hypothetical protein
VVATPVPPEVYEESEGEEFFWFRVDYGETDECESEGTSYVDVHADSRQGDHLGGWNLYITQEEDENWDSGASQHHGQFLVNPDDETFPSYSLKVVSTCGLSSPNGWFREKYFDYTVQLGEGGGEEEETGGPGGGGGPAGGPNPLGQDDPARLAEKVRGLKGAKRVLAQERRKMLEAQKQFEEQLEVFCTVGGVLTLPFHLSHGLARTAGQHAIDHYLCNSIPKYVMNVAVDADRKLDQNRQMIRKLDEVIRRLEGRRARHSTAGPSARASAAGAASGRKGGGNPLESLRLSRKRALAAMGKVSAALDSGNLAGVRDAADLAAARLRALPDACRAARPYLKKVGLDERVGRGALLAELGRLVADPLPGPLATRARAFHMSRRQMQRQVRSAKSVPKSHIEATSAADLLCSPKLDAIDRSLAAALRDLADSLA